MSTIQIIALCATAVCFLALLFHFIRIVRLGAPKDLSQKSGEVKDGVVYSATTAMLPQNKESAFLHLPTFTMGIIFHLGVFLALLIYVFSFFPFFTGWIQSNQWIHAILICAMTALAPAGPILFVKRIVNKNLRALSNADDFLGNGFASLFQWMTIAYLLLISQPSIQIYYYISAILLLLYIPVGKLRHVVYFFAARYHLGFFYGRRNVWPLKRDQKEDPNQEGN